MYDPELFDDDGHSADAEKRGSKVRSSLRHTFSWIQSQYPLRALQNQSKDSETKQSVAENVMDISPYSRIANLVKGADAIVPKARALPWVMRLVEELYDLRYTRDIAELKEETNDDGAAGLSSQPFPEFVYDFFKKRYGLQSIVQSSIWDLVYSVDKLRNETLEVGIFARFLDETYDVDDLLFFLYVRSVIQKELNINFRGNWSEGRPGNADGSRTTGHPASPVYLSARDCAFVARIVFGSELDPLYRTFMKMIEGALNSSSVGSKRNENRRIELATFLHLALIEYHETRPSDSEDEEFGQKDVSAKPTTASNAPAAPDFLGTAPPRQSTIASASTSIQADFSETADHSRDVSGARKLVGSDSVSLEASREVLEALGAALGVAQELLLDSLMAPCVSFPPAVATQIRTEASSTLEKKVYSLLGEIVAAHQKIVNNGGDPVFKNAEVKILTSQYQTLVHSAAVQGQSVEQLSGALAILAEGVVNASIVKDSVVALTNKLVDFSRQKLLEVHGMRQ